MSKNYCKNCKNYGHTYEPWWEQTPIRQCGVPDTVVTDVITGKTVTKKTYYNPRIKNAHLDCQDFEPKQSFWEWVKSWRLK